MAASVVADAVLALALGVHAELLVRLRSVDGPAPPWWFGYARDATNLSALLIAWGAYRGLGYATAVALLAAGLTVLATYSLDWLLARRLRLRRARIALALPLAAWVALVALRPAEVDRGFERLVIAVEPTAR